MYIQVLREKYFKSHLHNYKVLRTSRLGYLLFAYSVFTVKLSFPKKRKQTNKTNCWKLERFWLAKSRNAVFLHFMLFKLWFHICWLLAVCNQYIKPQDKIKRMRLCIFRLKLYQYQGPDMGKCRPGASRKVPPPKPSVKAKSSLWGRNCFLTMYYQAGVNFESFAEVKFRDILLTGMGQSWPNRDVW